MLIIRARFLLKNLRYLNICWLLLFLVITGSCSTKGIKQKGKLLAKVGSTELYDSDLKINVSDTSDLRTIKERLVKDWVKRQLLFKAAMANLSDNEKDKDRQLKDYYESLIIYDYFNKMTSANIDTSVSEKEMIQYYKENKKNFVTKRNIIRLIYVKVPGEEKAGEKLRTWIRNPDKRSMEALKLYSAKYNATVSLDTTKWFYVNELVKYVPVLKDYMPLNFERNRFLPEMNDGKYYYDINIIEFKSVGETSPFELVQSQIRENILSRRKTQMVKDAENMIYREGDSRHLFEIFDEKLKK